MHLNSFSFQFNLESLLVISMIFSLASFILIFLSVCIFYVQPLNCQCYVNQTQLFSVMQGWGLSKKNPIAHSRFIGRVNYQDSFFKQKSCTQARFSTESMFFSSSQMTGEFSMHPGLYILDAWLPQITPGNSCSQTQILVTTMIILFPNLIYK